MQTKIGRKKIILCKRLELKKTLTKNANKHKISTSGVILDMLWSVFFSQLFLWSHLHVIDGLCTQKFGGKKIILGKRLEPRKSLTKNANKPKISTLCVNLDMLWSFFSQFFLWSHLHLNDGLCNIGLGVWDI